MTERLETGPVQVPGDWPGIFIRGDNAFAYAMALEQYLAYGPMDPDEMTISRMQVEGLLKTLKSCLQQGPNPPEGTQTIYPRSVMLANNDLQDELHEEIEQLRAALMPFAAVVDGSRYDPRDERTLNVTGRAGSNAYKRAWHLLNNPE